MLAARRHPDRPFEAALALGARQVSVEELLGSPEVDAVAICTPNHLHRPHAEMAFRSGQHVFCEKPLALTLEDADALIQAARESRRVLMVGHLTRHLPLYQKVAEILTSKELGAPRAMYASRLQVEKGKSWRMDPHAGGGAPFDLLIHDFDLMNWYLGYPTSVAARARRHPQGAFDHLAAIFTFPDNAVAVTEGSFLLRPGLGLRSWLRLICDRGHIELDSTNPECPMRVFREDVASGTAREEVIPVPIKDLAVEAITSEFEEFFDAIEGTPPRRLRLEEARLAVQCAVLATRSAETGQALPFD